MRRALSSTVILALMLLGSGRARAWELFRSESSAVARGNQHLEKGQSKEALSAYDAAARELPDDPGVQLDRGLALLGQEKLGEAREAFRRAAAGTAPKELRSKALYNMGLAFLKEGELASKAEDLDGAKKMLEESVDSFKGSLRAQPANKDAAWNYELAKRRLADVQKKQEEKKKEEEKKNEQNKDKKENKEDKNQQNNPGDAGTPDQPKPSEDAGQQQPDGGSQADPDQPQGEDAGAPPPPSPGDAGAPAQPEQQPEADPKALPEHMERALDALEAGEENLEKQRARQRARARPRRVEKDW